MQVLPFVDLHVHSCYSDGTMTPAELVDCAVENGVGVLAIADHDIAQGSLEAEALCRARGVRLVPAVELDTLEGDTNFHVLGFGVDLRNEAFRQYLGHIRFLLDESSVKLIEAMRSDYDGLSLEDFEAFAYDSRLGGWKSLHYLLAKGLTATLKEGMTFYPRYGIERGASGFPNVRATCLRIARAGGRPVLAHPGELIDTADLAAFAATLENLVSRGLHGIECYYPTHTPEVTRACLDVCARHGLLVTAGSDCHGSFGRTRVGEMDIPLAAVTLGDLLAQGSAD